jgi:glyoxalase family protein
MPAGCAMRESDIRKMLAQGVHHIALIGADRQTSMDSREGALGMPFVFDQLNLDDPGQGRLYFDPGDGRLITIFTSEDRELDAIPSACGSSSSPTGSSCRRVAATPT